MKSYLAWTAVLLLLALGAVALLPLDLFGAPPAPQQGYDLSWWTVDGGGITLAHGGDYSLGGTAGQPDAGVLAGGNYTLGGGFWRGGTLSGCTPISGVTISGRNSGIVGVPYRFEAVVVPADATLPIQYTWTPAPGSGQGTASAYYTWSSAGTYNISVAVSNCSGAGTAGDDHSITIVEGTVYQVFLPMVAKH